MLTVNFISGPAAHRRKYGGGKGQLLAKAVGLKSGVLPSVLDLTAGLGRDAFVLATLGCEVTLVERHPEVYSALLKGYDDAIAYALDDDQKLLEILKRMTLVHGEAVEYLHSESPLRQQVIYLDPMFPHRSKTAAVKKEMVSLQAVVGSDLDADQLFDSSMQSGADRVVVKRPRLAPHLCGQKPAVVFEGKSSRFDVYPFNKLG